MTHDYTFALASGVAHQADSNVTQSTQVPDKSMILQTVRWYVATMATGSFQLSRSAYAVHAG